MPVFARAGCNMGSCHGAARGKDGFRLSLFGFDPAGDYHRLTRELPGRRIDLASPRESLLFLKSVGAVPHTGGKRFEPDSDLAATLLRWIEAGTPTIPAPTRPSVPQLLALDLYPPTALLEGEAARRSSSWPWPASPTAPTATSPTSAGMPPTTTGAVAVSPAGLTTSGVRGEAFVMARYDTITVGVPLVVIPAGPRLRLSRRAAAAGATDGARAIDDLVAAKLRSLRIAPSPVCDDETFLRRVTLDLVGLLPTPEERAAFLADAAADKRARKVDELDGPQGVHRASG